MQKEKKNFYYSPKNQHSSCFFALHMYQGQAKFVSKHESPVIWSILM